MFTFETYDETAMYVNRQLKPEMPKCENEKKAKWTDEIIGSWLVNIHDGIACKSEV